MTLTRAEVLVFSDLASRASDDQLAAEDLVRVSALQRSRAAALRKAQQDRVAEAERHAQALATIAASEGLDAAQATRDQALEVVHASKAYSDAIAAQHAARRAGDHEELVRARAARAALTQKAHADYAAAVARVEASAAWQAEIATRTANVEQIEADLKAARSMRDD